jgi:hypothetical protein
MTDIIPVSEAAASAYNPSFHPGIKRETELGERDQTPHVQAFARFEQSLSTDKERLIEALTQAASDFHLIALHDARWEMWKAAKEGRDKVLAALQDHQS